MTRTIIDINVLQTIPPSNINRDDTGSPKSATYGGTRRARVSSQAWKRATRQRFKNVLDTGDLGVRTKRVVELLGERIHKQYPEIDSNRAQELAVLTFEVAKIGLTEARKSTKESPLPLESKYLLFLSSRQLDLAAAACATANTADDPKAKLQSMEIKKILNQEHSIDLALFGRMVADSTDLNVDAACQVAHAISVHPVETEFDFYTAVDDHKAENKNTEDAGAGMIGTVEFNSSTLYRYATIDVDALHSNLGDAAATQQAVEAFVLAFTTSMPTGKQNTFANRTLPNAVVISVRDSQPVNLVGAFEDAIVGANRVEGASERLARYAQEIDAAFDTTPTATWVVRAGENTAALDVLGSRASLKDAVQALGKTVAGRL